jgi:putative transposase
MPRLKHFDSLSTARFVTFTTYRRIKLLEFEPTMELVAKHISSLREVEQIKVHGYVIMPDHVHLVITPPDTVKLGLEIGKMKARSAHGILSIWRTIGLSVPMRLNIDHEPTGQSAFWQRRCYDHNCRTPEILKEKINYCHMNPVKQKLVSSPEEWLYSSYNWYMGKSNVPVQIDPIEAL